MFTDDENEQESFLMEKPTKRQKNAPSQNANRPKSAGKQRPEKKSGTAEKSSGTVWGLSIYLCLAVVVLCLIFASCNGGAVYTGAKETTTPTPALTLAPAETADPDAETTADPDAETTADPNAAPTEGADATPTPEVSTTPSAQ